MRAREQIITEITRLGTDDLRIIYSPGVYLDELYDNQLLVEYNVECKPDQLAFFNVTFLDIEGEENCRDDKGNQKCQDFILIKRGTFGSTEICGNRTAIDSVLKLQSPSFQVLFRTSEVGQHGGFRMYAICFDSKEGDKEGCFKPTDFNQSVCLANGTDDGSGSGMLGGDMERSERSVPMYEDGLTYGDFFTGYPSKLKIQKDVANFHNQWRRQRREVKGLRFVERNVLFNETVDYADNTIRIFDPDNNVVDKYEGVLILLTFDVTGEISNFVGGVKEDMSPRFIGPGPLVILGRRAFLQKFVIDPRGLIPDEEEEELLRDMNAPLLDAIPADLDFNVTDPNQTIEPFPFFFPDERNKRQVEEQLPFFFSNERNKRLAADRCLQFVPTTQPQADRQMNLTEKTAFLALRYLEACNPVLKSQARASIQLYESINETRDMLQRLRNFTIRCDLNGSLIQCQVNSSFAPALPGRTTCEVNNNNTPETCEPFYSSGPFDLAANNVTSVIVRAINCNGQRVEYNSGQSGQFD